MYDQHVLVLLAVSQCLVTFAAVVTAWKVYERCLDFVSEHLERPEPEPEPQTQPERLDWDLSQESAAKHWEDVAASERFDVPEIIPFRKGGGGGSREPEGPCRPVRGSEDRSEPPPL